ncbi:hypothetical protein KAJ27_08865 [bacterium]|nr:hypothetical protein [bacterium]
MSLCHIKNRRRNVVKRAFTFVELLMVLSISILVFGIIYNFYYNVTKGATVTAEEAELVREGRTFIERCIRDLSCAVSIEKLSPRKIVFKKYRKQFNLNSINEFIKVSYVLSDNNRIFVRSEGGQNETVLKGFKIDPKVFSGYVENAKTEKFKSYDYESSSSVDRSLISFIRIKLSMKKRAIKTTLMTGVCLRPIHLKNLERGWNILH